MYVSDVCLPVQVWCANVHASGLVKRGGKKYVHCLLVKKKKSDTKFISLRFNQNKTIKRAVI